MLQAFERLWRAGKALANIGVIAAFFARYWATYEWNSDGTGHMVRLLPNGDVERRKATPEEEWENLRDNFV